MKAVFFPTLILMPAAAMAGAHLLGELTEAIPPLPLPPPDLQNLKPADIISTQIHDLEDRKIIIQEVTAAALPALPDPDRDPLALAPKQPLSQENIKARIAQARGRERERQQKMPQLSAVVYRSLAMAGQVRTLFGLRTLPKEGLPQAALLPGHGTKPIQNNQPLNGQETLYFWSTMDGNYLNMLPAWQAADGTTYEGLEIYVENIDLDRRMALYAKRGLQYQAPQIPFIPLGEAPFLMVGGHPNLEESTIIQGIHDLYNAEETKLKAAFDLREQAKENQADFLKANPPKPNDVVLRFRFLDENEKLPPTHAGNSGQTVKRPD